MLTDPAFSDRRKRFAELKQAEALLVMTLRLWAEPLRDPETMHPHWQDGLQTAGLSNDAAVAFDTVMRITIASATRALDVHRPGCSALGTDEARLLGMVRLIQQGDMAEAGTLLADWLPMSGVRMALAPLGILAHALDRAGLRLPTLDNGLPATGRIIDFPQARRMARTDPGARLLH
ncbi:hypothetical protein [Azospirillum griseum]|uniref:Uncharacterized protein n=1 Tax=Azospirillum griseum TaxID=2496639 RepID=A0A3S0K365_9PROT|nr:hypothetical protein [Azospirillum griseum]RTR17639.1 hypothetical protein EJ903_17710 [Azospirillum griseum]